MPQSPLTDRARESVQSRVMDIGGSHATAAIVAGGPCRRVVARSTAALDAHADRDALLDAIGMVAAALPSGPGEWTIAIPGPFDYTRGTGTFAGVAKFRALAGLDLRAELAARLDVHGDRIAFVNDATAYGVGEWSASSARADRFVCVTLGTGIGSVFLDHGRAVESGPEVPPHGWVHLLTAAGAPLEEVVSTRAIQRRWAEATGAGATGTPATVRDITEHARGGDRRAAALLDDAMAELGSALAPWIRTFGATELVVGGSMTRSWDLLGPGLRRGLADAGAVAIGAARLGDEAPLIGAAVLGVGSAEDRL